MGQQKYVLTLSKFQCDYKHHHLLVISSPGWPCEAWLSWMRVCARVFFMSTSVLSHSFYVVCIAYSRWSPPPPDGWNFCCCSLKWSPFALPKGSSWVVMLSFPRPSWGTLSFPPCSTLLGPVQVPLENLSPPPPTHCKQLCFTYCSRNWGGGRQACKISRDFAFLSCPCPHTPEPKFEGFRSHD